MVRFCTLGMFGFDSGYSYGISEVFWRVFRRVSFILQGNYVSEVGCTKSLCEEMIVFSDSREITASAGERVSGGSDSSMFLYLSEYTQMCSFLVLMSIYFQSNSKFHTKGLARL